jgi:hypothetical protein
MMDYTEALRINPRQALALYGRGILRRKLGDAENAERDMAAARAIASDIPEQFKGFGLE